MKNETFKKRFDLPLIPGLSFAYTQGKNGKCYVLSRNKKGKMIAKRFKQPHIIEDEVVKIEYL